jgi:hypothetical protein
MYFGTTYAELGFDVGDTIDLLFNVDINDYKNVQSAQMLVRDARMAKEYTDRITHEKKRYEDLKAGGTYTAAEDFLPNRDDCAVVYNFLRREYRNGKSMTDVKGALREIDQSGERRINYVKLKYVLEILNELNICEISHMGSDIYSFQVLFKASKTSIDKSAILKKLRSQCTDRNQ